MQYTKPEVDCAWPVYLLRCIYFWEFESVSHKYVHDL